MTMLKMESVNAGYGDKVVLEDVTLTVKKSEIVGLVGPNGSGKSTALKSIFGIVRVNRGKIIYYDDEIQNKQPSEIAKSGICYIPQGGKVFTKLTVQENLEMGGILIKDRKELDRRISNIYNNFTNLKKYKNVLAGRLSGGEQQMVGFCRGLVMSPEMMLVDEPSIGLAPKLVDQTMEIIKKIRENYNATILIVEQNVRALLSIADRVYLLNTGRIIHEEKKIDSDSEKRLRDIFLT